jgi:hypothetical protein
MTASALTADRAAGRRQELVLLTAALAWGAAVIHTVVVPAHLAESAAIGAFFIVAAPAQALWGSWIYRRPDRRLLLAGAAGSLAIVALWAFTRLVGVPLGPDAWRPESVGVLDVVATVDELLTAAFALALAGSARVPAATAWRFGRPLAYGLLVASLLAPTLGVHSH